MVRRGGWGAERLAIGAAALWLAAAAPAVGQAQGIGVATDVDRAGYRAAAGETVRSEIDENDAVFLLDRITTDDAGRLRLRLDDSSVLVVGPDSRLTIDEFVYDGGGSFVGDLSVGGFRFLSGDMPSSSYRIQTPTAVVGLRGTDVIVMYDPLGRMTLVIVLAGEVWVRPLGLEEQFAVEAGQIAEVLAGAPPVIRASGPTPRWSRITTEDPLPIRSNPGGGNDDDQTSSQEPESSPSQSSGGSGID